MPTEFTTMDVVRFIVPFLVFLAAVFGFRVWWTKEVWAE